MANRLNLQNELELILGSNKVYFQPPTNTKVGYPCIIYDLDNIDSTYASDDKYINERRYTISLVHTDPDTSLVDLILALPKCSFDRHYRKDNLHYFVYTIYY